MFIHEFYFFSLILPEVDSEKQINKRRYKAIGAGGKDIGHIEIKGNCCIKIYQGINHRGDSQFLETGFNGTPEFDSIRSMKFGLCECTDIAFCNEEF